MTQDNPAGNPNPEQPSRQPSPDPNQPGGVAPAPRPKKHHWLRRVLIGVGVLVLILLILLALVPTIASTGAARSYVLGKVNQNLNGHVEIADWSIGWTSGIKADGIKVFDDQNRQILEIPHVSTQLSLLGAARGQYHLGKTVVDGLDFNAERYPDRTLNFARLAKEKPAAETQKEKSAEEKQAQQSGSKTDAEQRAQQSGSKTEPPKPTKLPDVDGDIQLVNCRGTVQNDTIDPNTHQPASQMVKFTSIKGAVNIPNINEPITNSLQVVENTGGPDSGTVSVEGKLQIAKSNLLLDAGEMNVDEKVGIVTFQLASALGFCPPNITALAGLADGSVNIHLAAHETAVIDALLQTRNFKLGGPILDGDTYSAAAVTITVPKTTVDMSPGLGGFENYRIRVGPAGGKDAITLVADKTALSLALDLTPGMLNNAKANLDPGGAGMLRQNFEADLAPLARDLPHMLKMVEGRKLTGGHISQSAELAFAPKKVDVTQSLSVKGVTGENTADHKTIALEPIEESLKATSLGGGGKVPDLRNIVMGLTTGAGANGGYATANINAPTLSNLDAKVHVVLEKFQQEFSQFIDFGDLKLAGTMDAVAASKGNLIPEEAKPGEKLAADANLRVTLANLKVEGMKGRSPLNEPKIELLTTATLGGGKDQFVQTVSNINATLDTNDPAGPTIDTHFGGEYDMKQGLPAGQSVLEIKRIDLARLKALASGTPTTPGATLTKGIAKGTVNFGTENQQLAVGGNLDISEITVTESNKPVLTNEDIKLAFSLLAANDFSSATLPKADVSGSIFTLNLADTVLQLKTGQGDSAQSTPTLQMLKKTTLTFNVPDVGKLQAVLDSLSAPQAPKPVTGSGTASTDPHGYYLALANPKSAAPAGATPAAPTPPTKLAKGSLGGTVNIAGDNGRLVISSQIVGKALTLSKDNVPDPIGDMAIVGQATIVPTNPPAKSADKSAPTPTVMEQIASLQFTNFTLMGLGGEIKVNGAIDDPGRACNLKNVTLNVIYNATTLWSAALPLMSKEMQESYKDVKVTGTYTRQITLDGAFPADPPFDKAVTTLKAKGDIMLDTFEHGGASLTALDLPFNLAGGNVRVAYADKPEGQNLPAPAKLNGGNFYLGGASVNLATAHPRLNIPAGTKILENVSLNPLFASTFLGDYVNNPLFVGASQATGLLTAIINKCERLPIDSSVTLPDPSNDGVLDMTLSVNQIQIGNPMLSQISQQIGSVAGSGLNFSSLRGDVPSFTVKIAHGVVTQDMTLAFGESKRPFHLFGDVALNTRQMHMTADFPWTMFGMTPSKQLSAVMGDGVKLPLAGPVNKPQFNLVGLVQSNIQDNLKKNLTNPADAQNLLNNILGKKDKNAANPPNNQPSQQPAQENPADLLGDLFNRKDKNKKPPASQPAPNQ
ncbi:MAG TPA: hypothetical protein VG269_00215 [Tepidisphaeraceae bacterium]|jgi:hypothetical protein|nr:hypothetical protein [Tepidisphaeraceae bacterium]